MLACGVDSGVNATGSTRGYLVSGWRRAPLRGISGGGSRTHVRQSLEAVMRGVVTTVLEVGGVAALVAGVFVLFGLGWALLAAGAGALGVSWLVNR